jgi:penicillin-binding protein 1C
VFSLLGTEPWPAPPLNDLKTVRACVDDGYLAGGRCRAEDVLAPLRSHFQTVTPHHRRVHLDANGQRVHSGCEAVANMRARDWFVLPPAQAWFYRQRHPDYRPLPAWRPDCAAGARALDTTPPMAVIYPHAGAGLFIPRELGGERGRAVFRVVHERPGASLFWHLDDQYLGRTDHFHEWALRAPPGWHTLTLVDDQGFRLRRRFKVLGDH